MTVDILETSCDIGESLALAKARFNNSLRPQKPEGSLGRTAQDGHLDSHTAPEPCVFTVIVHSSYSFLFDVMLWCR